MASINDGHVGRGVPDVAGNASVNSGYTGVTVNGSASIGNGTSASAPLWAGLMARINAALGVNV
jgi:kumamolisin